MWKFLGLVGLFVEALSFGASADSLVQFYVLRFSENNPLQILIPVKQGEDPKQALAHYLDRVQNDSDLQTLSPSAGLLQNYLDLKPLNAVSLSPTSNPRFLLLANSFNHMDPSGEVISRIVGKFQRGGAEVYVLPVAAGIRFSEFRNAGLSQAINEFDAMVALGGNDIHPSIYGSLTTPYGRVSLTRDLFEAAAISGYTESEHGVFYGICRGHQFCAALNGFDLVQDIQTELTQNRVGWEIHRDGMHKVSLKRDMDSLLRYFMPGWNQLKVRSTHHQATGKLKDGKTKSVLAMIAKDEWGPNGVNEANQSQNGRILTVQFHPDKIETPSTRNFFRNAAGYARLYRKVREGTLCASEIRELVRSENEKQMKLKGDRD